MSGFEDDPIMLIDNEDEVNDNDDDDVPLPISRQRKDCKSSTVLLSSDDDLNDVEFEIVKDRFAALLPKYGVLWRQMTRPTSTQNDDEEVDDEEEEIIEKSTPPPSPSKAASTNKNNKNCAEETNCNCGPTMHSSFLPPFLLKDADEIDDEPPLKNDDDDDDDDSVSLQEVDLSGDGPDNIQDQLALNGDEKSYEIMMSTNSPREMQGIPNLASGDIADELPIETVPSTGILPTNNSSYVAPCLPHSTQLTMATSTILEKAHGNDTMDVISTTENQQHNAPNDVLEDGPSHNITISQYNRSSFEPRENFHDSPPDVDSSDEGENNEDTSDDEEEEDDEEDDSSAASTVLQWESWSQPDGENKHQSHALQGSDIPANITTTRSSRLQPPVENPNASALYSSTKSDSDSLDNNSQSVGSSDSERSLEDEDEEQINLVDSDSEVEWEGDDENSKKEINLLNSDSEVEWDGSDNETSRVLNESTTSVLKDLINRTNAIEIVDSSDDYGDSPPAKPKQRARTNNRVFKEKREELAHDLFSSFDQVVCGGRLGNSTTIEWTKKLRTTAGLTRLQHSRQSKERIAKIELSLKVLDDEERLRATLLHEICHAAAFVIDGVVKPPHGKCFQKWANRAMQRVPDVEVTTTHDYAIQFKCFWKCASCGYMYRRHSKSIDVKKHRCGKCKGKLFDCNEDGTAKKVRAPSAYQQFIKENSAQVREHLQQFEGSNAGAVSQSVVMQECARLWREQKSMAAL